MLLPNFVKVCCRKKG